MLWTVMLFLAALWLLGAIGHIGGALVHVLPIGALALLVIEFLGVRRRALNGDHIL